MSRRTSFLYALAWLIFAIASAISLYAAGDVGFFVAALSAIGTAVPAAVMGVGIWLLCERFQHTRRTRLRFMMVHSICALVYTAIWGGWTAYEVAVHAPSDVLRSFLTSALPWELVQGVLVYGVIAGVAYAIQANRSLNQQSQLAARAELQALRAQLDPHFLFNTLHSITALVHADPTAVENALLRFGSLLRYVLDASRHESDDVSLEDELRFVRAYLALEELRLGDRLRVVEDIDADSTECVVPALTLQPIVENAVRHGISPRAAGGCVSIRTRIEGDSLAIEVTDDGIGATSVWDRATSGHGLSLVRQRLTARFGSDSSVSVRTAPGCGFSVHVLVPAEVTRRTRTTAEFAALTAPTHTRAPVAV